MLSRLAWAAAQGSKQLAQAAAALGPPVSASCSSSLHHAAASAGNSRLAAWRQLKSSHPTNTWRTFSSGPSGNPRSILENAAEAQMHKLKTKAEMRGNAPPDPLSKAMGVLYDSIMLGIGGIVLFSGYYTWMYRDVSELESKLLDARKSLETKPDDSAPGPAPGPGTAPAPAMAPPKEPVTEPSAFPPLTRAWCFVMKEYITARKYIEKYIRDYRDPTYDKLLPDMAPELRGRVKTLVLDLDDTLIHKEWTRQTGWKIYKRPGVQDFLLEMGGYYEVVVFTDTPATYADPIVTKLDPYRVVLYRLYRPETQYHNGKHVRDLSKLNRDMSQVLMISSNPDAWEFQPENTIKLQPWRKDTSDTTLLDLIPMLQLIATKGVKDVRDVVRSYDGEEDIPKAFKSRMAQIAAPQKQQKQRGLLSSLGK